MVNCLARDWIEDVTAPVLVIKPESEMARESSLQQQRIMTAMGVDYRVIENGVHGSSMLVDERTQHDMSAARAEVLDWLRTTSKFDP